MKRSIQSVLLPVTAVLFLSITARLSAQPPEGQMPCEGQKGPGACMKELNLTEEQKAKLQELRKEKQPFMKEHHEAMRAIREKSKEELLKDTPDRALLSKYAKQISEQHRKMAESMTNHLLKVKEILTKEQFEKMVSRNFCGGMHKMDCRGPGCPHKQGTMKGCPEKERMHEETNTRCPHHEPGTPEEPAVQ